MKKTYISPESFTLHLTISQVLAVSQPDVTIDPDNSVDAGNVETKEVATNINVWDKEW